MYVHVIIFRLVEYENRKTGVDAGIGEEILKSLTTFEKKLVEEQDLMEIRGKVCVVQDI
jgi:hypothetical protein